MSLLIELSPAEEAHLAEAAHRVGLAPSELVKQLVKEHLPVIHAQAQADTDVGLRAYKERNGTAMLADAATQALFAKWVEEDAQLTDEERTKNDSIYTEIEKNGITRVQI